MNQCRLGDVSHLSWHGLVLPGISGKRITWLSWLRRARRITRRSRSPLGSMTPAPIRSDLSVGHSAESGSISRVYCMSRETTNVLISLFAGCLESRFHKSKFRWLGDQRIYRPCLAPLLVYVPSRVILQRVLVEFLVQVDRPRHAKAFVIRIRTMTTELHGFGDTPNRHDRGCVSKGLLGSRHEKRKFRRQDKLAKVIFDFLIRVPMSPGRNGLVDLINQWLETVLPLEVENNQPVPHVGGIRRQSEEERDEESRNRVRTLESHSINNLKFPVDVK